MTLVAVTLNAPDDWNDHKKLFDYGFSVMKQHDLNDDFSKILVDVVGGKSGSVGVMTQSKPKATAADSLNLSKVRREILIKHFEYAPIKEGDILGTVRYYLGDKLIEEVPLCAAADIELNPAIGKIIKEEKKSIFEEILDFFKRDNIEEKTTKTDKEEFKEE